MDRTVVRLSTGLLALVVGFGIVRAEDKPPAKDESIQKDALALNRLTGTNAMEGKLRALLRDEPGTKKLIAVAIKMAEEKESPFNYNATFVLAKAAMNVKEYETSKKFHRLALELADKLRSENKIIQVYDSVIDLFVLTKKYEDAIAECKKFLELDAERGSDINKIKPFVMERMIQAMARKGDTKEAIKLTNELVEADGDGWYFVRLKGEILREAGELDEAAKTYLEAIDRIKKNKDLDDERRERFSKVIRYALSAVYVDLKQIDKGAEQLEILLKSNPDNATFHNDLGYIWADHDMKLPEAEKLIRQAIELDRKARKDLENLPADLDKDNAAYLDSLGWVLFKTKKYAEAKKALLEAVEQEDGKHLEIYDHLADVHMALKETKDAVRVWEEALKCEDTSKRDGERREAIKKKLEAAKKMK